MPCRILFDEFRFLELPSLQFWQVDHLCSDELHLLRRREDGHKCHTYLRRLPGGPSQLDCRSDTLLVLLPRILLTPPSNILHLLPRRNLCLGVQINSLQRLRDRAIFYYEFKRLLVLPRRVLRATKSHTLCPNHQRLMGDESLRGPSFDEWSLPL